MFCHSDQLLLPDRTGSRKPDSELIGRFQKLCGKSFFNGCAAHNKQCNSFTEEENTNTPSDGAYKKSKGNLPGTKDPFTLDGCDQSDTFASSISENWPPHQRHNFDLSASQFNAPTTYHDLIEGRHSPKTTSHQDDFRLTSGLQPEDQFGDQAISDSLGSLKPWHLWSSMDQLAPGACILNQCTHQSSGYGSLELSAKAPNLSQVSGDEMPWRLLSEAPQADTSSHSQIAIYSEGKQFRYPTILRASTAMVNDSNDSPVSYLNKGQVYHLTVVDSMPSVVNTGYGQYQTFIQISFAEEQQRSDPAAYWKLWKSAREFSQSQKGDDKLKAVEYMGQDSLYMHIDRASHDGFCITWTGNPADGIPRCSIPVRFNFLSTDFTLSKGVKGIQVRLCSKTKQLGEASIQKPEICFCNVKLFRDHGAERKLSNDAASIRKRMERLKLQMKEPAPPDASHKRKRGSASARSNPDLSYSKSNLERQGALPIDLHDSPHQTSFQRQLQRKLDALEKPLHSSFPESKLSLRAGDQDDPELHPSPPLDAYDLQQDGIIHRRGSSNDDTSSFKSDLVGFEKMDSPRTVSSVADIVSDEISPNSSKSQKSSTPDKAACFYIRILRKAQSPDEHYRAIYLRARTVQELVSKIIEKSSTEPMDISCILHINQSGLKIVVDDEFVQEMAEGQNMIVRTIEIPCLDASYASSNMQYEIRLEYLNRGHNED